MADNVAIFNIIRTQLSPSFQDRIPQATQDDIKTIGTMITREDMQVYANEWLDALINKITFTLFNDKMLRNKLARFKKGSFELGDIIEEIHVESAKAKPYRGPGGAKNTDCLPDPFCKVEPDVKTNYHRRNRKDFYKVTVYRTALRTAFTSAGGLQTLVDHIVQSLYKGAVQDEYLLMKELFSKYCWEPVVPLKPDQFQGIDPIIDDATGKAWLTTLKSSIEMLSFNSNNFNPNGITTYSDPGDMTLYVKAGIIPVVDVETMAGAFNQTYLESNVPIIVVDDFGSVTDPTATNEIQAILADNSWWMVYDNLKEFTSLFNPEDLYWNYWLHVHQTYATSYFSNVIVYTTPIV